MVQPTDIATYRRNSSPGMTDPLNPPGGGGTSGDMNDDWKEGVDRQLGQLHTDVRALLRAGIAAVLALAAMIGGLYLRTDAKFESAEKDASAVHVEQVGAAADINRKLDAIAIRLERRGAKKP